MAARWRGLLMFALGALIEGFCLLVAPALLGLALARYFEAWNLTYRTISQAPGWLRALYEYSDALCVFASGGVLLGLSRLYANRGGKRAAWRRVLLCGVIAALLAVAAVAILTVADALRVGGSRPALSPDLLFSFALFWIMIAGCEGMERGWMRGALHRAGFERAEPVLLPLWAAVLRIATGASALQAVNAALLAFILTLSARAFLSIGPGVAIRFACQWVAAGLLGVPEGGAYGLRALYEIYPVSSPWLTGGARGLDAGAAYTVVLLLLLFIIRPLYRELRGVLPCAEWIARWTSRRRTRSSGE